MMRNDAVEVGPEPVNIRGPETFNPARTLGRPLTAAVSGHRALFTRCEVVGFFWLVTSGFHRMFRIPGQQRSWDKEASWVGR